MSRGKYISVAVFFYLVLCSMADGFSEAFGCESSCQQIGAAKEQTARAEHAPVPLTDTPPLKNITKRRIDPATLLLVTFSFPISALNLVIRFLHFSFTGNTYQSVPLYQSLQVYRF